LRQDTVRARRGPYAEPGEYTIKITAGSKEAMQNVTVEDDPRLQLNAEDRAARRGAIEQLYAMAKSNDQDRKTILGIQSALKTARENWKTEAAKPKGTKMPEAIVKSADELQKKVDQLALKYHASSRAWATPGRHSNGSPSLFPPRYRT